MNHKEKSDKLAERIKRNFPKEQQKTLAYASILGSAGMLVEYIITQAVEQGRVKDLPSFVKYGCGLISSHLLGILSDDIPSIKDVSDEDSFALSEQNQEAIYRKMKLVIEELYHALQEQEKI